MRVPTVVRPLPKTIRDAIPEAATDLWKWLLDAFRDYEQVINGNLELVENLGEIVTGTTSATAHNQNIIVHGLARTPRYLWLTAQADPAVDTFPITFYWTASDFGSWSNTQVTFRVNQPSIGYRGILL